LRNGRLDSLALQYGESHRRALALVEALPDEDLAWRPAAKARSIGWNLWQMAGSADQLQARLEVLAAGCGASAASDRLIWEADGLAERWGLEGSGADAPWSWMLPVGTNIPVLPGKGALLAYARRAFAAAERALATVAGAEASVAGGRGPLDGAAAIDLTVAESLAQDNRRLGEMEALKALQGLA
jgi:hypothetical protein